LRRHSQGLRRISYQYTTNQSDRSADYGHAVIGHFQSAADHEAYQVHPIHIEMKRFMSPYIEAMVVLDCQSD